AWMPTFIFPAWLQRLTVVMPTRWAVDGLDAMTWRGLDGSAAIMPTVLLIGFAILFGVLALARFRWDEGYRMRGCLAGARRGTSSEGGRATFYDVRLTLRTCVVRSWQSGDGDSLVTHANNRNISINLRDRFPFPYARRDGREFIKLARRMNPETFF